MLDDIKSFISKKFGLDMNSFSMSFSINRICERMKRLKISDERAYLEIIRNDRGELFELLDEITINETYFFREKQSFSILAELAQNIKGRINIFSIGCSSGEEVWSAAICLHSSKIRNFRIIGMDLSPSMIDKAREGKYTKTSFLSNPYEWKDYFDIDKNEFVVKKFLREYAHFIQGNILEDSLILGKNIAHFVFFRNVLLYFTNEAKIESISKIYNLMKNGGYLFVSSSENLLDFFPVFAINFFSSYVVWQKKA